MATGPDGHVVLVGTRREAGVCCFDEGFVVRRFTDRLPGTRLHLRDKGTGPTGRALDVTLSSKLVAASSPGEETDPSIVGAALRVVNPLTLETATIALPATGWTGRLGRGRPLYKYKGGPGIGTCKSVVLHSDRKLRAKCVGMDFTLDEPTQGAIGIQLSIGTDAATYCAVFGGIVLRDVPSGASVGQFVAKEAPPAPYCPL